MFALVFVSVLRHYPHLLKPVKKPQEYEMFDPLRFFLSLIDFETYTRQRFFWVLREFGYVPPVTGVLFSLDFCFVFVFFSISFGSFVHFTAIMGTARRRKLVKENTHTDDDDVTESIAAADGRAIPSVVLELLLTLG